VQAIEGQDQQQSKVWDEQGVVEPAKLVDACEGVVKQDTL
jgi:hypothetical protein